MISRDVFQPQQCCDSTKICLRSFRRRRICWVISSCSFRGILVPCRSCFPSAHCPQTPGILKQPKLSKWPNDTPMCGRLSWTPCPGSPSYFESRFLKNPTATWWSSECKNSLGKGCEGYGGSTDCLSQVHSSRQTDLANLITDTTTNSRLTLGSFWICFLSNWKLQEHLFNE